MRKKVLIIATICVICIAVIVYLNINKQSEIKSSKNIVTTFYPVYIGTLNITEGVENIKVSNITQNVTTCLHDYSLSTTQLAEISKADMLVINGAGMEPFIANITKSMSNIYMLDSSKNTTILEGTHDHNEDEKEHDHDNEENNSHIYLDISNFKVQVKNITEGLIAIDKLNENKYKENEERYIAKLDEVELKWDELKNKIEGTQVVIYNNAISYIANMVGLDVVADLNVDHESGISSNEVIEVIKKIKDKNIKYILVPTDYDEKIIASITSGLDVTVIKQDLFIYGENNKDAYTNIMENNLKALEQIKK